MRAISLYVIFFLAAASCWEPLSAQAGDATYVAAYLEHIPTRPASLTLFPSTGPAMTMSLPAGLPSDFIPVVFAPDGKAIYGGFLPQPGPWEGIVKIEFDPLRQSVVRGSSGVGAFSSLVVLPSGRILVAGSARQGHSVGCGVYEIDPTAGKLQNVLAGHFPDCGGAISPDGRYVLHFPGHRLSIVDLTTGTAQAIGRDTVGASWSPDGRWIAAVSKRAGGPQTLVLISAAEPSLRRTLGVTDDTHSAWSPDSKCLLLVKESGVQCGPYLGSLEVVDVQTGKRKQVRSSRCRIFQDSTGWLDWSVAKGSSATRP